MSRVPKKLLKKNLALFLEYRAKSLYGVPNLLPALVRRAVDHVMTAINKSSSGARLWWFREIITVVATHCEDAHCLAIAPTDLKTQTHLADADAVDVTVLAIAIYLRKKVLVTQLLNNKVDPWGRTHLFGHVMTIAAKLDDMSTTKLLLSKAATATHGPARKRQSNIVIEALKTAVLRKHWGLAAILVGWQQSGAHLLSPKLRQHLLESAAAAGGVALLQAIPDQRPEDQQKLVLGLLRNPDPEAVLRHCAEGCFPIWLYVRCCNFDEAIPLLDLAVRENNLPLVKAAIRVHHRVANAQLLSGMTAPFREAILQNNEAMVRFFLEKGVDPEASSHSHKTDFNLRQSMSTCELARPASRVYTIVRKAVLEKIVRLEEQYEPPNYHVWSKKEQKYVLVAYTFHAPQCE